MNNNPPPFDEQELRRRLETDNHANLEATIAGMKAPTFDALNTNGSAPTREGLWSRVGNVLTQGVEALTAVAVGAKELAFGTILAPLNFAWGLTFGAMAGYRQSRAGGDNVLQAIGAGAGRAFEQSFGSFAMGLVNAVDGATFRLRNLDRSHLSVTQSLRTLAGEIPLVGHLITGGNTPTADRTERMFTALSSGINALSASDDIQRSGDLLKAVGYGMSTPQSKDDVFLAPYAYGTAFDVAFSLLGLSNGYAYNAAQRILDQGVMAGDTVNFVGHSGGAQRMAMASRILADYDVYGNSFAAIAGPVLGDFNNLSTIGLAGSTGWKEPTSNLQWLTKGLVDAARGGEVSYQNLQYENKTIPHAQPRLFNPPDQPYIDYLTQFLSQHGGR